MESYPSRDRFAFASTGDAEEDAKRLDEFLVHEKRQIEGVCPNGCAPLKPGYYDGEADAYTRHCPVCRFHGHSNVAFTFAEQGQQP